MALLGRLVRLCVAAFGALILASGISAYAAANSVPRSKVADYRTAITANALKPAECAGISLSNVITGRGELSGTNGNDLLLGSSIADEIRGDEGNDCIVGGAGEDDLRGNSGNDVLLGGPDSDRLRGGGGSDICYRGAGNDDEYESCAQER